MKFLLAFVLAFGLTAPQMVQAPAPTEEEFFLEALKQIIYSLDAAEQTLKEETTPTNIVTEDDEPPKPALNIVKMVGTSFEPKELRVKVGTTVKWVNEDFQFHNVVGTGWYSPYLNTGNDWTKKFDKAGTYDYYCTPHRGMGMTGKIIVE